MKVNTPIYLEKAWGGRQTFGHGKMPNMIVEIQGLMGDTKDTWAESYILQCAAEKAAEGLPHFLSTIPFWEDWWPKGSVLEDAECWDLTTKHNVKLHGLLTP